MKATHQTPELNFKQKVILTICLGALYLVAARIGRYYTINAIGSALWPATGIGIGAVLLFGIRQSLPGLICGVLLMSLTGTSTVSSNLLCQLHRPIEAIIGGGILNALCKGRFQFKTTKDILAFLIFGVLLGPVVGTAFGVLSYYFYGVFPLESLGEHWMSFFFGNSLGALVFAPFMVSVSKSWRDLKTLHPMRLLEATALAFSLFFITPWALANGKSFLLYPFITWAALRFTFVGVSASTLTISSFAMMTQKLVFDSPDFDILWIQSFILTITTSAYFLATLGETEKAVEAKQIESQQNLKKKEVAEEALVLLDQTIKKSPIGFALIDRELKFIEINEVMARINGVSVEEHRGMSIKELFPWGTNLEEIVQHVFQTGDSLLGVPVRVRAKDQVAETYGLISYYPIRQPGVAEIFCVAISFEDLSEQNRVENMLREYQSRLNFAQEAGRMGVYQWNYITNEVQWTPQLEAIYGLKRGEFAGTFNAFLDFIHPDDRERIRKYSAQSMLDGFDMGMEFRIIRKDGEIRWLLARGGLLKDRRGENIGFTGINVDITEQKNIEERLRKAEGELREAISARDEFFAVVSHELKTPMTSLKLQIQLHQRSLEKGDPLALQKEKVGHLLNRNYLQLERMNRLVEDMLDVSRIRTGKLSLRKNYCEIAQVVRDLLARYREQFLASGSGEPEVHIESSAYGLWDVMRIEQVVSNVINNAIRYGQGKPISISVTKHETHVTISVKDQGIGISKDDLNRIFQRFERGGYSKEITGLGLGLFICEQIVVAHGGHIRVESKLHEGSTFHIDLPLVSETEAAGLVNT